MNFFRPEALQAAGGTVSVGVRPEDLFLSGAGTLRGTVVLCERLGEVTITHVTLTTGGTLIAKLPGDADVQRGQIIALAADPAKLHRFVAKGLRL